jgi:hypothetical protein
VITEAALRLFGQIWTGEQAVRLIGVGVSGLGSPPRQLSLWDAPFAPTPEQLARQQRVESALAAIQARGCCLRGWAGVARNCGGFGSMAPTVASCSTG